MRGSKHTPMTAIQPIRARDLLAPLVAVGLALILALLVAPTRSAGRVANLSVTSSLLPHAYVMRHRSESDMGYLVERRSSTLRRDRAGQAGRKRRVEKVPANVADVRATWLLRSRLLGTVIFVPVEAVPDWSLPYVHAWLRDEMPGAYLPEVRWVQLHIDRVYQGVYLKVALPVDLRKKEGGSGNLQSILETDGRRVSRLNTRFEDAPGGFMEELAAGPVPIPRLPLPVIAWLAAMYNLPVKTFIMTAERPRGLYIMPLPVALGPIFERARGRRPAHVEDERFKRWIEAAAVSSDSPFDSEQMAALQDGWSTWLTALVEGLILDRQARGLAPPDATEITAHLGALDGLGLMAEVP